MKFEYPNVLYALLLIAIPIIIHLFNFRKYKTLYFSSLYFIKQVNEETKSTQKLKHLLILAARILAFTSLIFAFTQPYLPIKNDKKAGSPMIALFVDNSFSMSLKGTDGELLSMAKEKARQIVNKATDDSKFLVVTNNFEGIEQRVITKENALERIDKIDYSPFRKDLAQVVKWMREGIQEAKNNHAEFSVEQLVLLTDFQKNTSLKQENFKDQESLLYPIQLSPQSATNICVDSIWFSDPNFKVGINNELNVRVKNYSDEAFVNLELSLAVNKTKRTVFVDLEKNSEQIIKINYSDQQTGLKSGQIQINDKQMLFDDDYYFAYEVNDNSSVLIIDGEDAVSNVAYVYGLDKYYQTQSIKQTAFTSSALQRKDLVILNGWNDFSTASVEALEDFLKGGGSLCVFPGTKIDASSYANFLTKINAPTLGALNASAQKISKIAYEDPFFKGMFDQKPAKLNLPAQTKLYSLNKRFSNFLNLIELENGGSLLFKTLKPYNCFVFTSSLADDFGNFKSNALFSSILLRMAETSQRRMPISLTIGSDLNFPIYTVSTSETPIRLKSKDLEFVPQILKENNVTYISIQKGIIQPNFKAGMFEVLMDQKIGSIALNYDRLESDIKTLNKTEIEDFFQKAGFKNVFYASFSTNSDASIVKIEKPVEYWRLFLIFALLFLVTEMALLKWMK
jgi:hypothetical protein